MRILPFFLSLLLGLDPLAAAEEIQDAVFDADFDPHPSDRIDKVDFSYNGRPIGRNREGFQAIVEKIARLPAGTSVVWGPNYDRCGACSGVEPANVAKTLYPDLWAELDKHAAARRLKISSSYPGPFIRRVKEPRDDARGFFVDWQNYQGPGTPHKQVLYRINGEYLGRGDEGFDRILERVKKLPRGSRISFPRYEYSGRWATETMSDEERSAGNARLRLAIPFAQRKRELGVLFESGGLVADFVRVLPGSESTTVMDWESGDRYGHSFVSFGRIIRAGVKPRQPAARLGWTRYEPTAWQWEKPRPSEATATYTLDDKELGEGVDGFATAMDELAKLPAGSVVQVRVCLRTEAPFACPLIYEGHRHFERTGFEPYVGLFPWLLDVARQHKLEIDWLPDEQKSCGDCELNK